MGWTVPLFLFEQNPGAPWPCFESVLNPRSHCWSGPLGSSWVRGFTLGRAPSYSARSSRAEYGAWERRTGAPGQARRRRK